MDIRRNQRRGGSVEGESAYTNAQRQPSRPPSLTSISTSAPDVGLSASQFLVKNGLRMKIGAATCNRGIESANFVPQKAIREIWPSDRVRQFLAIFKYEPNDEELRYFRANLLKILSILVVIGWGDCRLDKSIPFPLHRLEDDSFLGEWGEIFYNAQHAYAPIEIQQGDVNIYPQWMRPPFIRSKSVHLGKGTYGSVSKEVIAIHQFKWKESQTLNDDLKEVARKQLTAQGDFRKETRNLLDMNSSISQHDNVVRYLAIIVIGDEASTKDFNILLPLASFDLQKFLYSEDSALPKFQISDLIRQASSIADAIKWMHEGLRIKNQVLVCCHMDLKLDNILVYLDEEEPIGKWKISDFGISTLKPRDDAPRASRQRSETLNVPGSNDPVVSPAESLAKLTNSVLVPGERPAAIYQAPEVSGGGEVGRSSDVWSYCCILFQILARGVGPGLVTLKKLDGLRKLEEDEITLHETDYFFRETKSRKYLNPHVKKWLEESHHDGPNADRVLLRDCRGLISKILKIVPSIRLKAVQVNDELLAILSDPLSESMSEVESIVATSRQPTSISSSTIPKISVSTVSETSRPGENREGAQLGTMVNPSASDGPSDASYPIQTGPVAPHVESEIPLPTRLPDIAEIPAMPNPNPSHGVSASRAHEGSVYFQPTSPFNRNHQSPSSGLESSSPTGQPERSLLPAQGNNPSSPTSLLSTSQGSASRSNRSQSLASGPEVRVAWEYAPCNTAQFVDVKSALQAFVSSPSASIGFMTKNAFHINARNCLHNPYKHLTIRTDNVEWECGSSAGNFLTVVGRVQPTKQRTFRLYKISTDGVPEQPQSLQVVDPPSNYNDMIVSPHGRLVFQAGNCAWLYGYCNDSHKKELLNIVTPHTLHKMYFGTDGLWVFAETSMPGPYHRLIRIKVWNVRNVEKYTHYDYQHEVANSTHPVKHIIPFPRSPFCIVWAEHGKLCILSEPGSPSSRTTQKIENLQALAVTPDEKSVVFITKSLFHHSEILFSRIQNDNGRLSFGKKHHRQNLKRSLASPSKCAIGIRKSTIYEDHVTILVAHINGTYESHEIDLRIPPEDS